MNVRLVKLTKEYKEHLEDMMREWNSTGEKIVPYAIRKNDYHNFDYYLDNLEITQETDGKVPDTTLFCLDVDRNIFVGAVNIRHYLTKEMLVNAGHIGDGIRPTERRKGYATAMIGLALKEAKKLGISRVLMVCDKNNIGSAKSIINNGGVLENEVIVNGITEQRYWIDVE
ncbi:MAG: GNAT family N-acetyltransferase [Lachnospiraceae bacterium]|nr:GNAT family N-acetyltransferase [Lachnospiraceae bacterium]